MATRGDNTATNGPPTAEDAVLAALADAPIDDEPENDAEIRAVAHARRSVDREGTLSSDQLRRILASDKDHS